MTWVEETGVNTVAQFSLSRVFTVVALVESTFLDCLIILDQERRSVFRIGGGGGARVRKNSKFPARAPKSQYKTLRAERAAKLKIVYV